MYRQNKEFNFRFLFSLFRFHLFFVSILCVYVLANVAYKNRNKRKPVGELLKLDRPLNKYKDENNDFSFGGGANISIVHTYIFLNEINTHRKKRKKNMKDSWATIAKTRPYAYVYNIQINYS